MRRNSNEWVESDAWKSTMSESGFGKIQATPKKKFTSTTNIERTFNLYQFEYLHLMRITMYISCIAHSFTNLSEWTEVRWNWISSQYLCSESETIATCERGACATKPNRNETLCVYENEAAHRRNCLSIAQTKANKMKNTKMVHDAILARCTSITHSHLNSLKSMFAAHLNCCYDLFMHLYRLLHVKRTNKSAHTHTFCTICGCALPCNIQFSHWIIC